MSQSLFEFTTKRKILSVSELTQQVKGLFEKNFAEVWVEGEVSNFRPASSGHLYFTLKDAGAQLRAVCFRNQARYLKFKPQDGISVIARGRLSVYEARGEYQLYVEMLEPAGLGALQLAFEQLKAKLATEGLFDPARKKPLPVLPRTVGVVTSPTGAVIRDILRVLKRRFRNMNVLVFPVKVQGEGAAKEIAGGIEYFNRHAAVDVMIVARGGGSLEDLWAFNEEVVARAIAGSKIPVISAVGHETDFTISDFVADLRAPTPSAAAELVVHRKQDYVTELENRARRMSQVLRLRLSEAGERLTELRMHRVFQTLEAKLEEGAQRVDDIVVSLDRSLRARLNNAREGWLRASAGVIRYDFRRLLELKRANLGERDARFESGIKRLLFDRRSKLNQVESILRERSPLGILSRGYSITRDAAGNIVRDAATIPMGGDISVRLARGEVGATVKERKA
ncbi:MAG TPA: exodeoxyribonuclease VII large subunit [Terriglobia bacterium]|nr:exodeoxyribonuclease VII large subunit [Terriglobia bacterium]